ncbi:tRNA (adenosine(37)-N6)-threonylcarbamoyltransferase complex ATPase subunit type 1 TsaE [Vagococcus elongatus]|uniref:tRNA threonylcarbamoyladenosine biosynthesis protein TsaE n=1 Tax=Vagococcus elongatus TaxID=180344 RepID=A0A430AMX3_9ENTE|nr:tRNA (adenosine(37)-N6)-threonylcarbamoyltransferase complex ATPase subunit type 1 TsaE [Vagococcus elongatus]RSU09264.1 tRNA (adenosine(37)-N6)-threonylcarbamoyltransferase complex ATPase subunit type 1 TsaE [Vagococcus elongatus]
MNKFWIQTEEEMLEAGEKIGRTLNSGDVLVLTGELGTGKTTLTKGIAKGLEISQMIKSPTYTIIREYTKGRLPLFHMDVYRLGSGEGESIGLDEYFDREGVVVMEWGTNLSEELPEDYVEILLTYEKDQGGRLLELVGVGEQGQARADQLSKVIAEDKL